MARLDVDHFPSELQLEVEVSPQHDASIWLSHSSARVDISDPRVLWFRRLGRPGIPSGLDPRYVKFAIAEADHTLESVLNLVRNDFWVNEYWACRRASNKPLQQQVAAAVGLRTLEMIVTNSPLAAAEWLASRPGAISKTLSSPVVYSDDEGRGFSFTHVLSETDRSSLEAVALVPTQFQLLAPPAFEVRVTSIRGKHVAVKLVGDSSESDGIRDWRSDRIDVAYEWCSLPDDVAQSLSNLLGMLKLEYAASDFIVDEQGAWYFLEANPHGAWLWLDDELGEGRITRSVAAEIQGLIIRSRSS